jgi:hypothetical protein
VRNALMSGLKDIGAAVGSSGTLATSRVLDLEELFDIFGIKRGNWRALALRLAHGRWSNTIVIDDLPKLGRPKEQSVAVADQIFIQEVAGIKCGGRKWIQQLAASGCTVPRIVAETKMPTREVEKIMHGGEMSDRTAVRRHLEVRGTMRGHSDEVIKKTFSAMLARHSRAIKAYGRPK